MARGGGQGALLLSVRCEPVGSHAVQEGKGSGSSGLSENLAQHRQSPQGGRERCGSPREPRGSLERGLKLLPGRPHPRFLPAKR